MTKRLHFHFSLSCIGRGNGNPLPCSCLENPRDGGAWWAAIYEVAQSWTQLKRLSSSSIQNLEKWYWRIYLQGSSRETDIENRLKDMERGGEGKMYGKSNMEIYITICKIDSQWEFAVWLRKLKQGLCINLEGWDRKREWKEVQKGGDTCIPMADSCRGLTESNKIL